MTARLNAQSALSPEVAVPRYQPEAHGTGIVHIGLGAFHKAHQAVYTDDALAASGGDWRIIGVSLRSTAPAEELTPQDGRYTTIERDTEGSRARVIGSLATALSLVSDRAAVLAALCAPSTKIVSLTVTEKGYGIDRATGGVDPSHPAIAADLSNSEQPQGVAGLLVWALAQRRAQGTAPFTVLCCDNLPENGSMVRGLLIDFARRTAPDLVEHIAQEVAFPATMVDRITPARSVETLELATALTGYTDAATVECEGFRQWVVEDHFPSGRPAWEAGGAVFVEDVRPFEEMKLRMLNGAHSMLAYAGFLSGHKYVRDVMADPHLAKLVKRHLKAAASTLSDLPGVDLDTYAAELFQRFANPHLAHETYQIAMDGSEKMPQRIFAPTLDALERGAAIEAFAFATSAWMRYTTGRTETGESYALRDPLETSLSPIDAENVTAESILAQIKSVPGLVPSQLSNNPVWEQSVLSVLQDMLVSGVKATIQNTSVS